MPAGTVYHQADAMGNELQLLDIAIVETACPIRLWETSVVSPKHHHSAPVITNTALDVVLVAQPSVTGAAVTFLTIISILRLPEIFELHPGSVRSSFQRRQSRLFALRSNGLLAGQNAGVVPPTALKFQLMQQSGGSLPRFLK